MSGGNKRINRYRIASLKPEFDGSVKLAAGRVQFRDSYFPDFSSRLVAFLKARSAPASVSSVSASRAASMKRLDCSGSSGLRLLSVMVLVTYSLLQPTQCAALVDPEDRYRAADHLGSGIALEFIK